MSNFQDNHDQTLTPIVQLVRSTRAKLSHEKPAAYRFDIFKGMEDVDGKIQKLRSIGAAVLVEGAKTYTVYLKPLLSDVFYILPEEKGLTQGDYVILTREPSPVPTRKYFWNNIGEGHLLASPNAGLMRLEFDLFGAGDIYMSLHPMKSAQASTDSDATSINDDFAS